MNRLLSIYIVFLGLPSYGAALAQSIAVEDLPGFIKQHNSSVQRAAADEEIAKADQDSARADFLPNVTLKATQTRTDSAIQVDIPAQSIQRTLPNGAPFRLDIDPPALTIQDRDVTKAQLQVTQALYLGGRLTAQQSVRNADFGIKQAEFIQEQSLQLGLVLQRYFQTQYAEDLLQVLQKLKTHLQNIDRLTRDLIAGGALPRAARLKTESALAELQAKIMQAEAQKNVLCQATQSLLGASGSCQFKSLLKPLSMPTESAELKRLAGDQRAEWKILRFNGEKAEAMHQAATGSLKPSVYAFGRYELLQDQLTALEPKWVIGVSMEWTLTAGLKALPERQKAETLRQKVEIARSQAARDIPLQIDQYWAQATGDLAALQAVDKARAGAQETLEISKLRYSSGDGSQFDVLQAYSELEKLSIRRLELLESYNRSLISLFQSAGDAGLYINHYQSQH